jgi:hypothetical protein
MLKAVITGRPGDRFGKSNILASFLSLLQFNHQNKLNILVEIS